MSIDITTFKSRITPKLHGTTLAKLGGSFYDKMFEAQGNFFSHVKPYSVIRRARIENAIYDKVYNYAVNSDVEVDGIIDIRPIGERSTGDDIRGTFSKEFDIEKEKDTAFIEYINGTKTLRLSKELTARTILHRMDSLTLEGTITLGGDASNGTIDTLDHISGMGALNFDLDGVTGQATITLALSTAIDLSDLLNLGALFAWLKFPDVSRLTSVDLQWGSSTSVYWNETATAFHDRSFTQAGDNAWGLLRHEWVDATNNGSAAESDSEAIDHIKITINYSTGAALTDVKLDNITASLGEAWEIVYYSNALFTDSTGATWKQLPTADTDLIQLDGADEHNAFLMEMQKVIYGEIKGKNQTADVNAIDKKLGNVDTEGTLYYRIAEKYPNQALQRETTYYEFDDIGSN